MLELSNVEVVYNEVILVLRGLSITVPDGQIVALLGANGAGKTTTLRTISGLLDVHDGVITKGLLCLPLLSTYVTIFLKHSTSASRSMASISSITLRSSRQSVAP